MLAYKHLWPVTPLVRGKFPGRVARSQRFLCYPRNSGNIHLLAQVQLYVAFLVPTLLGDSSKLDIDNSNFAVDALLSPKRIRRNHGGLREVIALKALDNA